MLTKVPGNTSRLLLASSGQVRRPDDSDPSRARAIVLRSLERKFSDIPASAWEFEPFESADAAVRCEVVKLDNGDIWSARFSEPDSTIAGREWRVEVVSSCIGEIEVFSCRLSVMSRDRNFRYMPSTPGLLKEVTSQLTFFNGARTFNSEPVFLDEQSALERFCDELSDPNRWWNCVVVSESNENGFLVDPGSLQRNLLGVANVFALPPAINDMFTDAVGKNFEVHSGAARTFRKGYLKRESEPFAHPVLRAPGSHPYNSVERAIHILGTDAFEASISRRNYRSEAPSFSDVRQAAAQRRTSALPDGSSEQVKALKDEVQAAKEDTKVAIELGEQAEDAQREAEERNAVLHATNLALLARLETLTVALGETGKTAEGPMPESYDDIPEWVQSEFPGKIRLHPRAKRSLKGARYQELERVVSSLKFLAEEYRDHRRGLLSVDEVENQKNSLGVGLSGSISPSRAGEKGDEYFVDHKSKKTFLEYHLTRGNSKDERYSMRIYFFYDDEDEEVVIGSLPAHLENRMT